MMRDKGLRSMNPFSRSEDPLDSLLRQWRDANALSPEEARGIRDRVVGRVGRSQTLFDAAWWRECLGAGLGPLRDAMSPRLRLGYQKRQ